MKWHAIGLATVALAATPSAQSTRLGLVPIVGHWEQHTSGQETIVTVDATKWDRKPVGGRVGFWAKPDSVSAFKGLQIE